jgi:hypothetical protein
VVSRNRAIARSGDVDWVDPLVGFRVRPQLAPGQALVFRLDVGGFDAGNLGTTRSQSTPGATRCVVWERGHRVPSFSVLRDYTDIRDDPS